MRKMIGLGVAVLLPSLAVQGCVQPDRRADYGLLGGSQSRSAGPGLALRWTRELVPKGTGSYVPVEQGAPTFDAHHGRVYVGSTRGALFSFDNERGRMLFQYDAKSAVEAQPAVDGARNELYVPTARGTLLALRAHDASTRWQTEIGGPVSQPPVLSGDAIYLVTDSDAIVALARADGAVLWRYQREPREGFGIAGHAGLTLAKGRLLSGFADGTVVALDASDGRVAWEVDTSLDLEEVDPARRFTDVDTTPAVSGKLVFAASFTGGLYAIDLDSGGMQAHHAELQGITAIAATEEALIISSAPQGIVCLDLPGLNLRWKRPVQRGNAGRAQVRGDNVYITESGGALLALALADGRELGRLETAHGITAPAALEATGQGFVLSNAGTLYAFSY